MNAQGTTKGMTILLASIAGISLLVGGILSSPKSGPARPDRRLGYE